MHRTVDNKRYLGHRANLEPIYAEYIDENEEQYRGFVLRRDMVYQRYWYIGNTSGPIPRPLDGSFTKKELAKERIDQYLLSQETKKEKLMRELSNAGHNIS